MKEDKKKKERKENVSIVNVNRMQCVRVSVCACVKNGEFLFFNFVIEFLSFVCLFIFSIFVL